MQAGIQGYLATTYAMDRVAAQAADIVYLRRPSFGTFGLHMEVAYLFGIPQTVNFAGVVMDADRVASNTEHQGNCYEDWVAFNRSSGMRNSALEHQIPEQLFSTETEPAEGVSTAKALAIATAEGQRIYTLTQENASQLANITIDDGARAEIQAGLDQGMEVTVHQSPISVNGWQGSGYAILDSDYGVGTYKISGGESGGFLASNFASLMDWFAVVGEEIISQFGGPFAAALVSLKGSIETMRTYLQILSTCDELSGTAGVAAIGFVLSGFIALTTIYTAINPFLGLTVGVMGAIVLREISIHWIESCAA